MIGIPDDMNPTPTPIDELLQVSHDILPFVEEPRTLYPFFENTSSTQKLAIGGGFYCFSPSLFLQVGFIVCKSYKLSSTTKFLP